MYLPRPVVAGLTGSITSRPFLTDRVNLRLLRSCLIDEGMWTRPFSSTSTVTAFAIWIVPRWESGKANIKVASRSDEAAYNEAMSCGGFVESHFTYSTLSTVSDSSSTVLTLIHSLIVTVYSSASAYDT